MSIVLYFKAILIQHYFYICRAFIFRVLEKFKEEVRPIFILLYENPNPILEFGPVLLYPKFSNLLIGYLFLHSDLLTSSAFRP